MTYNDSGHACISELSHAEEISINQFKDELDPSIFLAHSADELWAIWKKNLVKDYKVVFQAEKSVRSARHVCDFLCKSGHWQAYCFLHATLSYHSNQALLILSKVCLVIRYFVQACSQRRKLLVVRLQARLLLLAVRKAMRKC